MKKNDYRLAFSLCAAVLFGATMRPALAEDIDLFVGTSTSASSNPNVLIVIDNSSNWSAANQGWAGGIKQGQAELRAV